MPGRQGTEELLSFKPQFAPIKLGVFPLVNKEGMPEVAEKLMGLVSSVVPLLGTISRVADLGKTLKDMPVPGRDTAVYLPGSQAEAEHKP